MSKGRQELKEKIASSKKIRAAGGSGAAAEAALIWGSSDCQEISSAFGSADPTIHEFSVFVAESVGWKVAQTWKVQPLRSHDGPLAQDLPSLDQSSVRPLWNK